MQLSLLLKSGQHHSF
uniref:Uncharacterized protein n=1 Tax=Rhizophora mucronata TaxID=61149 RepID=A0A2P2NID1_RHIMU